MDSLEDRARKYDVPIDVLRRQELDVKVVLEKFIPCRSNDLYEYIVVKIFDKIYLKGDVDGR